jgi:hypothetical protein
MEGALEGLGRALRALRRRSATSEARRRDRASNIRVVKLYACLSICLDVRKGSNVLSARRMFVLSSVYFRVE